MVNFIEWIFNFKTYSQKCSIDEAENIAINTINEKINPISKSSKF